MLPQVFRALLLHEYDDQLTVSKKKILLSLSLFGIFLCVIGAWAWESFDAFTLMPAFMGSTVFVIHLLATKTVVNNLIELLLYCDTATLLILDCIAAKSLGNRSWPNIVVLLDVALVCRLPSRVAYRLICSSVLVITVITSEQMYRWGLFDIPIGNTEGQYRKYNCNCEHPPCTSGILGFVPPYCMNLAVFLLDFYFTRDFAYGMEKEHEKMEAAIHATERIASSLSHFDLTSAEAVLSTSTLPEPLHDALDKILTNLEIYRPYLPDALFTELHCEMTGQCNVPAPGSESGIATLVFTDIQGSTATWELCPDGMREGLKVHDKVMRECIAAHGGYEVKTIGDSFMVAFEHARSAVSFSLAVQEGLVRAMWPLELLELEHLRRIVSGPWCGLRVRVGVHCGEVDVQVNPLTGRYDYFGNTVNKAARMEGACVGGAVAVTQEVLEEVGDLGDVCVIDMGAIDLKGVQGGVSSYLLLPESLKGRREYVEGQMHLKREDRKLVRKKGSMMSFTDSSTTGTVITEYAYRQELELQYRASATVGVMEVVVASIEVSVVIDVMNSVLGKVVTSTERTHGTVVSLQGSRVAVSWNTAKPCATHVENSLVFVRMVGAGWDRDLHIGLGTGGVVCGTVGGRRQKFVAVLGTAMEVAAKLCTDASRTGVLCYCAVPQVPAELFEDPMIDIVRMGMFNAQDGTLMHLYETSAKTCVSMFGQQNQY